MSELRALDEVAKARGQTLAQMALTWVLRGQRVTSALIGASSVAQLEENLRAADGPAFTADELAAIDEHSSKAGSPFSRRNGTQRLVTLVIGGASQGLNPVSRDTLDHALSGHGYGQEGFQDRAGHLAVRFA